MNQDFEQRIEAVIQAYLFDPEYEAQSRFLGVPESRILRSCLKERGNTEYIREFMKRAIARTEMTQPWTEMKEPWIRRYYLRRRNECYDELTLRTGIAGLFEYLTMEPHIHIEDNVGTVMTFLLNKLDSIIDPDDLRQYQIKVERYERRIVSEIENYRRTHLMDMTQNIAQNLKIPRLQEPLSEGEAQQQQEQWAMRKVLQEPDLMGLIRSIGSKLVF